MAGDIRSFFGGRPIEESGDRVSHRQAPAKRGRNKKVLDDSDDDVTPAAPKKAVPNKAGSKRRAASPEGEATTTSDYFGSKKSKRTGPGIAKNGVPAVEVTPREKSVSTKSTPQKATPTKQARAKSTPNARSSARSKKAVSYKMEDEDEDMAEAKDKDGHDVDVKMLEDDQDDEKDDVFTADYKKAGRGGDDYEEEEDMEQAKQEDSEEGEEETKPAKGKGKKAAPAKGGRKRKSEAMDDDDESPKKARAPKKSKAKSPAANDSAEMTAIFDSIPQVKAPSPPPPDEDGVGKKNFQFGGHANSGPAPAAGSMEIPVGAEGCLAGLTFVFTGLLTYISREDGQALVKRYGGKITAAPSKNTSFVVLGSDAGPSKLKKIKEMNIKTINEEGLFALISRIPAGGGDSKVAAEYKAKQDRADEKVQKMAAEEEAKEKMLKKAEGANPTGVATGGRRANDKAPATGPDSRLWTVKHAPSAMNQICGNQAVVERLQKWLKAFSKNLRVNFKLGGADGSGAYRAVIMHGPPGVGKTTAAHLVAKLEGYDVVETNASDTRSKKLVEAGLKGVLSTTSLMGYFAGDHSNVEASKRKLVLIMDEVDGMSAGDRGGIGALAAVCRKSKIPIILICNDRKLPKMKPFDHVAYDMQFRRPSVDQIRGRIRTICYREGLQKLPTNVIDALIEGSRADIRQVVNMLSSIKLDQEAEGAAQMDFTSGKEMSKAWEKHVVLKSWDTVSKILGGGLFAPTSKVNLNGKAELYFNDHDIAPLMLQENYLGTNPVSMIEMRGREKNLKHLELAEKAASSISDGDLVDRMIHGSEQHWALMPTHAIFSFVRPASFVAGSQAGHQTSFPAWLGKNSTTAKLQRLVKEIQGHMRLRASGDRHEIRQQYLPTLWSSLVNKMQVEGKEVVPQVIELMDSYFLTKDDWDAIMELGVGPMDSDKVKIEPQTKATFTRLYNLASHPLPFMKASQVFAPKQAAKVKPDLEEALEESDEGEVVEEAHEDKPDAEDNDLTKDKYVKQPKKKKAPAKGKGAGKKGAAAADDDEEDEVEEKPKKGKGKSRAKK